MGRQRTVGKGNPPYARVLVLGCSSFALPPGLFVIASFRRIAWVLTLASLASVMTWSVGCAGDLTEIVVVVDSDLPTPQAFDEVTILIEGMGAPREVTTDLNARPLPLWLGVVNEGDKLGPITVTVTGKLGTSTVVTAVREEVRFQKAKTLMLRVDLWSECVTSPSACSLTCDEDTPCLVPWSGPPVKLDAAASDSGPTDAGSDTAVGDGGADDARVEDAGDAGDAGDAMPDSGFVDPCTVTDAVCFNYTPSNFDPLVLGAALAANGALTIDCADAVFDSTTLMFTGACAVPLQVAETVQAGGVPAVVIAVTSLTIEGGSTLRLIGDRPVIFAVFGPATINGTLDAGARGDVPGAGGNMFCTVGTGSNGEDQLSGNRGGGGGGGGSFGSPGASGGVGGWASSAAAAGATEGDATLAPLRGGCGGGRGGWGTAADSGNVGGAGGGAFQVSAAGRLSVGGVTASGGGGGQKGMLQQDGAGGGGSGGAILLEAGQVAISDGAWISSNGGGGGGGYDHDTVADLAQPGSDATPTSASGGDGGDRDSTGGRGGDGSGANAAATAGEDGSDILVAAFPPLQQGGGGGGGGGGVGRIRIRDNTRSAAACTVPGNFSPAAVVECGG